MSGIHGSLHPLAALTQPKAPSADLVVIALCAQWCGTCREFRLLMEGLAADRPGLVFVWADIEDDAALVGDIEVENFPTLAIFSRGRAMYSGLVLPQVAVVEQLIRAIEAVGTAGSPLSAIPAEVEALGIALRLGSLQRAVNPDSPD